jgi:hypothetical protein
MLVGECTRVHFPFSSKNMKMKILFFLKMVQYSEVSDINLSLFIMLGTQCFGSSFYLRSWLSVII